MPRGALLVNYLLTITIKVKIAPDCRIAVQLGVTIMKKVKGGRGFWDWLMGHGWTNLGSNG